MDFLGMLKTFKIVPDNHALIQLFDIFSSATFIILPILPGISALKKFTNNIFLEALIDGFLKHLVINLWTLVDAKSAFIHFLCMNIDMIS